MVYQQDIPTHHLRTQAPLPKHDPPEHFCQAIKSIAYHLNM